MSNFNQELFKEKLSTFIDYGFVFEVKETPYRETFGSGFKFYCTPKLNSQLLFGSKNEGFLFKESSVVIIGHWEMDDIVTRLATYVFLSLINLKESEKI